MNMMLKWRIHSLLCFLTVCSSSTIRTNITTPHLNHHYIDDETYINDIGRKEEGLAQNAIRTTQTASTTTNTNNNTTNSASSDLTRAMAEDTGPDTIIGGVEPKIGKYPYFVQWSVGCGGSLIAPDIVLTAAHCGDSGKGYVHVGAFNSDSTANGAVKRNVLQIVKHPRYNSRTADFDFALLKLDAPVWKKKVQLNFNANRPWDGQELTVMGLGSTQNWPIFPSTLREVEVNYMTNDYCNNVKDYDGRVKPSMLCAGVEEGQRDSCIGDSGGPIVIKRSGGKKDLQVGIVSWGDVYCADNDFPGVYSRVSRVKWWIQSKGCNLSNFNTLCRGRRRRRVQESMTGNTSSVSETLVSLLRDDDDDD